MNLNLSQHLMEIREIKDFSIPAHSQPLPLQPQTLPLALTDPICPPLALLAQMPSLNDDM